MSICPFWSSGNRKFECYSKCPMHKENTNEDCIFSLYLSQEHKNKGKKAINIDDIATLGNNTFDNNKFIIFSHK